MRYGDGVYNYEFIFLNENKSDFDKLHGCWKMSPSCSPSPFPYFRVEPFPPSRRRRVERMELGRCLRVYFDAIYSIQPCTNFLWGLVEVQLRPGCRTVSVAFRSDGSLHFTTTFMSKDNRIRWLNVSILVRFRIKWRMRRWQIKKSTKTTVGMRIVEFRVFLFTEAEF